MDYKLDLDALGGEGSIDASHEGERPWRVFSECVLSLLPYTWRHPADSSLATARFARTRRLDHREARQRAAAAGARHAAASAHLSIAQGLVGRPPPADEAGAPNVIVSRRRHGIEVLHLLTGRTLTQLPLPEASSSASASHSTQAHADLNGDGKVDHLISLSSAAAASLNAAMHAGAAPHEAPDAARADADAGDAAGAERGAHLDHHLHASSVAASAAGGRAGGKGGGKGGGAMHECYGIATSGVPPTEALWNAGICAPGIPSRGREAARAVAAPLLLPRRRAGGGGETYDSIFLSSEGRISSISPSGDLNWAVLTDARWAAELSSSSDDEPPALLPSLSLLRPTPQAEPLVLAIGESRAVVLSAAGRVLSSHGLPAMVVAPPLLADFSGDGVIDVVLTARTSHYGLRVSTSASSLLLQLLFAFVALAVALTVALRYGHVLE